MGKVERGEHMPTLAVIFKIARALDCSTAVLMAETESQIAASRHSRKRSAQRRQARRRED